LLTASNNTQATIANMNLPEILREFYDWTEAWAPLIPIAAWLLLPAAKKNFATPTQWYFFIALVINIIIDVSWKFKHQLGGWAQDNNVFYNIQSLIRALLFLAFFYRIQSGLFKTATRWIAILYLVFVVANYIWLEPIETYASKGASAEALALLVACLLYLFKILSDDEIPRISQDPYFWITIGLLLYVTTNFAIFLGYASLMITAAEFAVVIWDIHNAFYLLFCILAAKAYFGHRQQPA
jgi:hypothetical protein